ncbi:MAG: oxaloacetate decarboxylase subunit alpha [Anaerolineae bacterium]|nr:oxaloacetate decarboxylase subunit alpha [Anaerolineae bacterium]
MTGKIQFTDVTLRDGQQSLAATRMTTAQALRVLPHLREAGFRVMELWGGATLDSCIRFTDEDPWERLETFAAELDGSAQIQALVRGQNLFGYQPYPDDLVVAFTRQAIQSGIGVMRIFDALNDLRNIQTALIATKAYGAKAEAALSYTISPVHTSEYFVNFAATLQEEGADQIAIKDMAGILHPIAAAQLIPAIKQRISVPLSLHCHSTAGVSLLNAVVAMRAGIDAIDTAVTPFAGGSSLPPVELLMVFAEELGIAHDLEHRAILRAQEELFVIAGELRDTSPFFGKFYRPVRFEDVDRNQVQQILKLLDAGDNDSINAALRLSHQMLSTLGYPDHDDRIFESQIPGGMLTNLYDQIRQMGQPPEIMDQVMAEIPQVRADVGYVPLVTPTSQIVGSQAAFNVISGERYRFVSEEFKMILRGEFGRTPAEPNPWVVKKVLGSDEPRLRYRPASYLKPVLEDNYPQPFIRSRKDLLLHLLFGKNADDFLLKRCPPKVLYGDLNDEIICF